MTDGAGAANVNVFAADVAALKPFEAAFITVTLQLVAALALSEPVAEMVQWAPAAVNFRAPEPEPPEVETLIDVPTVALTEVFVILSVF